MTRFSGRDQENKKAKAFGDTFIFSANGTFMLTPRSIGYHFDKIVELAGVKDTDTRECHTALGITLLRTE